MTNIVEFPAQIRLADFMAEEALKQQIRQCLGAAVGTFHGKVTSEEMIFAMEKMDEALTLMRSYWAVQSRG